MDNHQSDGTVFTTCSQLLSESHVLKWSPKDAMNAIHVREPESYVNTRIDSLWDTYSEPIVNSRAQSLAALECDEYMKISPLSKPTASRRLYEPDMN